MDKVELAKQPQQTSEAERVKALISPSITAETKVSTQLKRCAVAWKMMIFGGQAREERLEMAEV